MLLNMNIIHFNIITFIKLLGYTKSLEFTLYKIGECFVK